MNRLLIAALLATVAIAPAYAGKDRDRNRDRDGDRRSERSIEDQVQALQDKLQDEDLSDRRRERVEDQLERIVEKYGITLPPPVEPPVEPTALFKDDFNRDQTEVGNGWLGHDGSIESEHMRITDGGEMYRAVPLDGKQYETITVSFDVIPDANTSGDVVGQDVHMFWTEGDPAQTLSRQDGISTELAEFPDHTHYTWTTPLKLDDAGEPQPYTAFGFGFIPNSTTAIDNVVVNGVTFPASTFVGF